MALASIDDPMHGDRCTGRATREETRADFFKLRESSGSGIDAMNAHWRAVIDRLCADERSDAGRSGWVGVSMGTAYGLPLVAVEPRIKAAALGTGAAVAEYQLG